MVAIGRLGETYAAELAVLLGRRPIETQRAIASLERAGVVASRLRGRTRIVSLEPRFYAKEELYALLLRLSSNPRYEALWERRRRPRAIGKAL